VFRRRHATVAHCVNKTQLAHHYRYNLFISARSVLFKMRFFLQITRFDVIPEASATGSLFRHV